jgi:hypothetical protein
MRSVWWGERRGALGDDVMRVTVVSVAAYDCKECPPTAPSGFVGSVNGIHTVVRGKHLMGLPLFWTEVGGTVGGGDLVALGRGEG